MNTHLRHLILTLSLACHGFSQVPGDVDLSFKPDPHSGVFTLVELSSGKIMQGTHYSSGSSFARLHSNGKTDTSFGCKANTVVEALAECPDGKILFGGGAIDNTPETFGSLAFGRFDHTGKLEKTFLTGHNNSVDCFAFLEDGKFLIAGAGFKRMGADDLLDESFNAMESGGRVYSFAIQPDGKIVMGGSFEKVRNVGRKSLARVNSEGVLDGDFHPRAEGERVANRAKAPDGTGANGTVFCIVLQPDGKILVGGSFTGVAGTRRNLLARLHADGGLDKTFAPLLSGGTKQPAPAIYSMALQTDGKIIIGGDFTGVDGVGRNNIARLMPDGKLDPAFYPRPAGKVPRDREKAPKDTGANGVVHSLSLQQDGKVLVGGWFSGIAGVPGIRMARLHNEPATSTLERAGSLKIRWMRGGSAPEVGDVVLQRRKDDTWEPLAKMTRIPGGWEADAGDAAGTEIRARGTARGGRYNGTSYFVVQSLASTSSGTE